MSFLFLLILSSLSPTLLCHKSFNLLYHPFPCPYILSFFLWTCMYAILPGMKSTLETSIFFFFFYKTNFYITEGSFLGLVNCLYKKTQQNRMNSSVPNQLVTHQYKPTVSWQTTCFHFPSRPRARILIHFSRDSTGNRKDCGIKIFIYTLW